MAARLGGEPQPAESRGREPCERFAARRVLAARADRRALDLPRAPGLDQLSADRRQHGVAHGRLPAGAHAAERVQRGAEEPVARISAVELGRVVVEREDEARFLDRALVGGADDDGAVAQLPGSCPASFG